MASDLAEVSARFGAALRLAGLPVGPGRCERFAAAVSVAKPRTQRSLYLCALATLVSSKDHALILQAVFNQVFGSLGDGNESPLPGGPEQSGLTGPPARSSDDLLARAAKAAQRHAAAVLEDQPERSGETDADSDSGEADREVVG